MSQILDDNFDSYTLGITAPFGPWTGTGLIIQPGTPPSAAPPGKACAVGQVFAPVTTVASGVLSWSMAMGDTNLNGVPVAFLQNSDFIHSPFSLLKVTLDSDYSMSLLTDAGFFMDLDTGKAANSLLVKGVSIQYDEWHFFQLKFVFSTMVVLGVNVIYVTATFFIDGIQVTHAYGSTGHFWGTGGVWTGGANINQISFENPTISAPYGSNIDNVTLDDDISTGYPHPAVPPLPNARVSQAVVEVEYLQNPFARVSQAAVEVGYLQLPFSRISQIVVEVIGQPVSGVGQGWLVKES